MYRILFAIASVLGPFYAAGNFPRDLYGPVDTRDTRPTACSGGPCIWGHADSDMLPVTFKPPAGYRVVITALRGDLIAWIKTLPGDPAPPPGSAAGVLGGLQVNSCGQSPHCDYCASGAPLFIQDSVTAEMPKTRAPFNYQRLHFVLDSDNVLNVKVADFLNTTGKPIHIELTYVIEFSYEAVN